MGELEKVLSRDVLLLGSVFLFLSSFLLLNFLKLETVLSRSFDIIVLLLCVATGLQVLYYLFFYVRYRYITHLLFNQFSLLFDTKRCFIQSRCTPHRALRLLLRF